LKTLYFVFYIIFILISCSKEKEIDYIPNDGGNIETIENNPLNIEEKSNNNDVKIDYPEVFNVNTIEYINYYIFNDLELKWNYNSIEEIIDTLNINDIYSLNISVARNTIHSGEGFNYYFHIVGGNFKVTLSSYSINEYQIEELENIEFNVYWLLSIEIIINNTYIHLFPYENIEVYYNDNAFGSKPDFSQGENNVYYIWRYEEGIKYGDDSFGYSDLIFENSILKSIVIIRYIT